MGGFGFWTVVAELYSYAPIDGGLGRTLPTKSHKAVRDAVPAPIAGLAATNVKSVPAFASRGLTIILALVCEGALDRPYHTLLEPEIRDGLAFGLR